MISSSARNGTPGFGELTAELLQATWLAPHRDGIEAEIQRSTNNLVLDRLIQLALNEEADTQVRALALNTIIDLESWMYGQLTSESDSNWRAHYAFAILRNDRMREDPASIKQIVPVKTPPGEPIGTTLEHF